MKLVQKSMIINDFITKSMISNKIIQNINDFWESTSGPKLRLLKPNFDHVVEQSFNWATNPGKTTSRAWGSGPGSGLWARGLWA